MCCQRTTPMVTWLVALRWRSVGTDECADHFECSQRWLLCVVLSPPRGLLLPPFRLLLVRTRSSNTPRVRQLAQRIGTSFATIVCTVPIGNQLSTSTFEIHTRDGVGQLSEEGPSSEGSLPHDKCRLLCRDQKQLKQW
jgi:hypothetical protein